MARASVPVCMPKAFTYPSLSTRGTVQCVDLKAAMVFSPVIRTSVSALSVPHGGSPACQCHGLEDSCELQLGKVETVSERIRARTGA